MSKQVLILLYIILFFGISCSSEKYNNDDTRTIEEWVSKNKWFTKQTTSYNEDVGASVEIDSKGNIYFIGNSGGGVGEKDNFYGETIYDADIFIVKYNKYFERVWVKTITSNYPNLGGAEGATNIIIDSTDSLILLGHSTGDFDTLNEGGDTSFLLKLDNSGNKVAIKQTTLSGSINSGNLVLDADNNIYQSNSKNLVKYNSNLITQWSDNISDNISSTSFISIDSNNNLYYTGYYSLGSGCSTNYASDLVFGKYNLSNRSIIWEKKHSICSDKGTSITTDSNGFVYVSGNTSYMYDNVTRGNGGELLKGGGSDCFLIKIQPSDGEIIWTRIFGSVNGSEEVNELKTDSGNNLFITGYTTGSFETGYKASGRDIFLIKFDSNGDHSWSRQLSSEIPSFRTSTSSDTFDVAYGLAIDSINKRIYIVGMTQGNLDGNNLTYSGVSTQNSTDAFITRTIDVDY